MNGFTLLLSVFLLAGFHSQASPYTALDFLRDCRAVKSTAADEKTPTREANAAAIRATSYISGVFDTLVFLDQTGRSTIEMKVPADGIENEQLVLIVLKHLESNPEHLEKPARGEVIIALVKAFRKSP